MISRRVEKKKRKLPASFSAANNPANYSACSIEKAVTEVRLFGFMLYSLQCAASLSRGCCTLLEDRAVPYRAGVVIAVNGRTSTWNAIRLAKKHRSVNQWSPTPTALKAKSKKKKCICNCNSCGWLALSLQCVLSRCARLPLSKHRILEMEGQGGLTR